MNRGIFLTTQEGQLLEHHKRRNRVLRFNFDIKPLGKNSSAMEKHHFRELLHQELTRRKRRKYKGDIVLMLDFYVNGNNPPPVQALCKNYLDLMHKAMPGVDALQQIFFNDDRQVKILIAKIHLNTWGRQQPGISLTAQTLSDFIKDVELAHMILHNTFLDKINYAVHEDILSDLKRKETSHIDALQEMKKEQADNSLFKQILSPGQHGQYVTDLRRHVQQNYLRENELSLYNVVALFQHAFFANRHYRDDPDFRTLWELNKDFIFIGTDFIQPGNAPTTTGDTKLLLEKIWLLVNEFKEKYKILDPLVHPIHVTILLLPPASNTPDADNLAIKIIRILVDILHPPFRTNRFNYSTLPFLSDDESRQQQVAPHGVNGFQVIQLKRMPADPEEGKIDFIITDGMSYENVWEMTQSCIDKWEEKL